MRNIIKMFEEPWDYSLYKINDNYVITIEFYEQIVDFNLSFSLTEDEIEYIHDKQFIKRLVNLIRKDKESYMIRNVKIPDLL